VKVPAGYKLYSKHIYDNTSSNPNNPNSPPITVYSNTGTNDEMLFDGMLHLAYQTGDELIDIESIINSDPLTGAAEKVKQEKSLQCIAFPNPFEHSFSLRYLLRESADVSIEIKDITGRTISVAALGKHSEGVHEWEWNAKDVAPGVYFYKLKAGNSTYENKIIKKD
jgi:hypothetical protein